MTAEKYIKQIVKRIHCSSKRRNIIKQDLLKEIQAQTSQGISLEEVMAKMGSIAEVADNFNENISEGEKKKYRNSKIIGIVLLVAVFFAVIILALSLLLPRYSEISESAIFEEEQVRERVTYIIDKFEKEDFEALQDIAIDEIKQTLDKETLLPVKKTFAEDWGEVMSRGQIYIMEITQTGAHFALSQVNVGYENVSITYTITLDSDLNIAGLYMK